jgi:hypothetical protein
VTDEPETMQEARLRAAVALLQLSLKLPDDDELRGRVVTLGMELAVLNRRSRLRMLQGEEG